MDTSNEILISGASVAGPALAYWLSRHGFRPVVVERSAQLRDGGYAVDFRGKVHLGVLAKMDILDQIRARQTHLSGTYMVTEAGETTAELPGEIIGGDVEILRGDLAKVLYDATKDSTEYIFADSITSLTETTDGVVVTFEHAKPRTFALVIGADGLRSNVRRLAFGEHDDFVTDLGMFVSIFTAGSAEGFERKGYLCSVPERTAGLFDGGGQAIAQLYFHAAEQAFDYRDVAQQKKIVAAAFAGMGWRVPQVMAAMDSAPDFYFDRCQQVHVDSWSRGRVALIGDAAAAAGPGGNGTGNAVVAAYVLAGELAVADGDYAAAFRRYEDLIRPYVAKGQKQAKGGKDFLAPADARKIAQRDRFFRLAAKMAPVRALIKYLATRTATAVKLPDYIAGLRQLRQIALIAICRMKVHV